MPFIQKKAYFPSITRYDRSLKFKLFNNIWISYMNYGYIRRNTDSNVERKS